VLKTAIAQSRFVLLGETHSLAEVARFAGAVCKVTEPEGFHTLAIEEGPLVTAELERGHLPQLPTHSMRLAEDLTIARCRVIKGRRPIIME
jgi:hypothetical protein